MTVYGVDYLADGEELEFLIVEADSLAEAKKLAGKELNSLNLPKRNIVHIEEYAWLEK